MQYGANVLKEVYVSWYHTWANPVENMKSSEARWARTLGASADR